MFGVAEMLHARLRARKCAGPSISVGLLTLITRKARLFDENSLQPKFRREAKSQITPLICHCIAEDHHTTVTVFSTFLF